MSLVAWLPRLRLHSLSIGLMLACLLAIWLGWSLTAQPKLDAMSAAWFEQTFAEEKDRHYRGSYCGSARLFPPENAGLVGSPWSG